MNAKLKHIRERMAKAVATENRPRRYERIRCPSLKQMALYANERVDGLTAVISRDSDTRVRKAGRLIFSSNTVEGNVITFFNRKGEKIKNHNTAETYRRNTEIATFILEAEERGTWWDGFDWITL